MYQLGFISKSAPEQHQHTDGITVQHARQESTYTESLELDKGCCDTNIITVYHVAERSTTVLKLH